MFKYYFINLLLLVQQNHDSPFERRVDSDPDSLTPRGGGESLIDGIPDALLFVISIPIIFWLWVLLKEIRKEWLKL